MRRMAATTRGRAGPARCFLRPGHGRGEKTAPIQEGHSTNSCPDSHREFPSLDRPGSLLSRLGLQGIVIFCHFERVPDSQKKHHIQQKSGLPRVKASFFFGMDNSVWYKGSFALIAHIFHNKVISWSVSICCGKSHNSFFGNPCHNPSDCHLQVDLIRLL